MEVGATSVAVGARSSAAVDVEAAAGMGSSAAVGMRSHAIAGMGPSDAPAICARGFSFSYPGAPPVLEDVGWRVAQGEFALLTGATGSGKTTLLRCCKPELAPVGERAGELFLFGRAVAAWNPADSSAAIGYVAQNPETQLVCDEVWHELAFGLENLGTAPGIMRRHVAETAQFFGVEAWMHRAVAELSGGQKQLVNLASVLVMQPRLLLFDEPTAQLDPVAEKNFLHELFRVNRELGVTVVVATHAPEVMAAYATCAFEVRAGKVEQVDLSTFCPKGGVRPLSSESRGLSENGGPLENRRFPENGGLPAGSHKPVFSPASEGGAARFGGKASSGGGKASSGFSRVRRTASCFGPSRVRRAPSCEKPTDASASACALSLDDVFFRYAKGASWVLRGLDFFARPGGIHAIVGGNGSGKSTLLRVAARVRKPERGRVCSAQTGSQALLPQEPKTLFVCDTVEGELSEWAGRCGFARADVVAAARCFGLDAFLARHPYDLSGGQQQLLALAKVLLTRPSLLFLDEPVKGLDAAAKLLVARALLDCAQGGAAIVCATHDLGFAAVVASDVSLLFDGQLACTEPTASFFAGNRFYRPVPDAFSRLWEEERGSK